MTRLNDGVGRVAAERDRCDRATSDEATAQGVVFGTDDHEEGVQAFLEDREPEFEGQ